MNKIFSKDIFVGLIKWQNQKHPNASHYWYTSAANQGLMIKPLWLTHLITEILEYYRCIRIKHGGLRYGSMWNHSDFISSSFVLFWFSCWFSAITWMFHSCSVRCVSSLCLCECRLGKPASGKRFLGDLSVSAVESVPLPPRCPPSLVSIWTFRWLIVRIMLGAVSTLTCTFMPFPAVVYVTGRRKVHIERRQTTSVWFFMACVTGP